MHIDIRGWQLATDNWQEPMFVYLVFMSSLFYLEDVFFGEVAAIGMGAFVKNQRFMKLVFKAEAELVAGAKLDISFLNVPRAPPVRLVTCWSGGSLRLPRSGGRWMSMGDRMRRSCSRPSICRGAYKGETSKGRTVEKCFVVCVQRKWRLNV
jgi:hypothetical protein